MTQTFPAFVRRGFHLASRFRLSRFMMVGATCAALNNALIIGLAALGAHYLTAALIAFGPVALTGYLMHASFTFGRSRSPKSFLRYVMTGAMNFPIWYAGMFVFCDLLGAPVAVGSPAATLLAFAWNYASAHWVFLRRIKTISHEFGEHESTPGAGDARRAS